MCVVRPSGTYSCLFLIKSLCCKRCASARTSVSRGLTALAKGCRKPREGTAGGKDDAGTVPVDLDNTQIEDLVAEFSGNMAILPGALLLEVRIGVTDHIPLL